LKMFYKLYRDRWHPGKKFDDAKMERVYKGFQEIYKRHGVKVIGAWDNADDTDEGFLITAYRDAAHYEETVAKMREDPTYQELSKTFEGTREMLEVVNMNLLPGSPT
jgi:GTP cyclohydrolase I